MRFHCSIAWARPAFPASARRTKRPAPAAPAFSPQDGGRRTTPPDIRPCWTRSATPAHRGDARSITFNCAVSVRFLKLPFRQVGDFQADPQLAETLLKEPSLARARAARKAVQINEPAHQGPRTSPPSLPSEFAAGNRSAPNENSGARASEPEIDASESVGLRERAPGSGGQHRSRRAATRPAATSSFTCSIRCTRSSREIAAQRQTPDPARGCKPLAPIAARCTRADCLPGAAPDSRPNSSRRARAATESHRRETPAVPG